MSEPAPLDLDAIRARADAAPDGEWVVSNNSVWVTHDGRTLDGLTVPFPIWADGAAEFIAHAREDIPALLDLLADGERDSEVNRLRAELADWKFLAKTNAVRATHAEETNA